MFILNYRKIWKHEYWSLVSEKQDGSGFYDNQIFADYCMSLGGLWSFEKNLRSCLHFVCARFIVVSTRLSKYRQLLMEVCIFVKYLNQIFNQSTLILIIIVVFYRTSRVLNSVAGSYLASNMPKLSVPLCSKLQNYVNSFGSDVFSTDGKILLCKICEQSVNYEMKYFISQHVNTTKHKNALSKPIGKKIYLLPTVIATSSRQSQFALDLYTAFVNAGIPLWKLENPTLRQCFEKYMKRMCAQWVKSMKMLFKLQ
jgi:hypothetical protein